MRDLVFTFIGLIGGTLIGWSLRDYRSVDEKKAEDERFKLANEKIDRCIQLLQEKS